jgi:hypothetical protein
MITYKIVEKIDNGKYKYLFHERRNLIRNGDTLIADKKMVYESYDKYGNKKLYLSGIHVIETEALCRKYLKRFKDISNKVIITCHANGCRKKPKGNPGVLLADAITIIDEIRN